MKRRRGNVALGAALMLVPLTLLAGMAIDFGRAYLAQERLSAAVDAGALAGARVLGLRAPDADVAMYFNANFVAGRGLSVDRLQVTAAADAQTLAVTANGRIATTFLRMAGPRWASLPVTASATARRTTLGMEVALVLDVTGSMLGNGALGQMRLAATDLVGILFGGKTSLDTLYISVVPYASAVNVGSDRLAWLQGGAGAVTGFAPFRWRGCVEARPDGEDQTDTPPTAAPFRPFLYGSTRARTAAFEFGNRSGNRPVYGDADWGTMPAINSNEAPDADDTDSLDPRLAFTGANERKGPNVGCGQPVAGLTNDRRALERIIGGLQATHRGGTMGNVGLQMGWMTLSPRWRGLWGASPWGTVTPPGLPLDYPGPRGFMQKVIVMMTDGDNNWFDYGRPPAFDYTAYGRLPEGRLGTTSGSTATTRINDRMLVLCDRIKAQGIRIYTITLGTSGGTRALYQACASGPGHYFHAPTAGDLRGAFREIGTQLSNLRLER